MKETEIWTMAREDALTEVRRIIKAECVGADRSTPEDELDDLLGEAELAVVDLGSLPEDASPMTIRGEIRVYFWRYADSMTQDHGSALLTPEGVSTTLSEDSTSWED